MKTAERKGIVRMAAKQEASPSTVPASLWVLVKDYRNGTEVRLFRKEANALNAMVQDMEESGEIQKMGPDDLQFFHNMSRAQDPRALSEWWGDRFETFYSWYSQAVE